MGIIGRELIELQAVKGDRSMRPAHEADRNGQSRLDLREKLDVPVVPMDIWSPEGVAGLENEADKAFLEGISLFCNSLAVGGRPERTVGCSNRNVVVGPINHGEAAIVNVGNPTGCPQDDVTDGFQIKGSTEFFSERRENGQESS